MSGIIEKIRRLFALADPDSGATEGEREAATAQAARLMAKYDIERGEVGTAETPGRVGMTVWREIGRDELWIMVLATAVSNGLGSPVEVFRHRSATGSVVQMVGSPVKVEFVQRLSEHLVPQLRLECAAALIEAKADRQKKIRNCALMTGDPDTGRQLGRPPKPWTAGDSRAFNNAFLKTAASEVQARIREAYDQEVEAGSTALVLRSDQAANADWMADQGLRVHHRQSRLTSREGSRAGAETAGRVDVRPGSKVRGGTAGRLGAAV